MLAEETVAPMEETTVAAKTVTVELRLEIPFKKDVSRFLSLLLIALLLSKALPLELLLELCEVRVVDDKNKDWRKENNDG